MIDFSYVYKRGKPTKFTKFKEIDDKGKHLVKIKRQKDYDYYVCDYCGQEIRIKSDKTEMIGGTHEFSTLVTGIGNGILYLALCNKCLNPTLKAIEERREKKEQNK